MQNDLIIQCPICEWNPDGAEHWTCGCGQKWNSFTRKGKCPKCQTQYEDTRCPACGQSTPHSDWHKTKEEIEEIEKSGNQELRTKKKRLEARLIDYGIKNHRVSYLPYLDHSKERFRSEYDAGCRMMILYAIAYSVHNLEDRKNIIQWFKNEKIWDKVSPKEKEYLSNPSPDSDTIMDFSWRTESAIALGWCLNKVENLSRLDTDNNEDEFEEFLANVLPLGESLQPFLSELKYRDKDEIYEENLVNEIATTYFRDLMFNGNDDETKIDRFTSFERHQVLNWLRSFLVGGNQTAGESWDEVDTST